MPWANHHVSFSEETPIVLDGGESPPLTIGDKENTAENSKPKGRHRKRKHRKHNDGDGAPGQPLKLALAVSPKKCGGGLRPMHLEQEITKLVSDSLAMHIDRMESRLATKVNLLMVQLCHSNAARSQLSDSPPSQWTEVQVSHNETCWAMENFPSTRHFMAYRVNIVYHVGGDQTIIRKVQTRFSRFRRLNTCRYVASPPPYGGLWFASHLSFCVKARALWLQRSLELVAQTHGGETLDRFLSSQLSLESNGN